MPTRPLQGAVAQIRYKLFDSSLYEKLKVEFDSRPIWSKNALRERLKFSSEQLKVLMNYCLYLF